MANVSQATLDAEKVECPSCKSQPNRQCVSRATGYVTALHPARIRAGALAAERARAPKLREVLAALVLACDHNVGDYNKALADARELIKEE